MSPSTRRTFATNSTSFFGQPPAVFWRLPSDVSGLTPFFLACLLPIYVGRPTTLAKKLSRATPLMRQTTPFASAYDVLFGNASCYDLASLVRPHLRSFTMFRDPCGPHLQAWCFLLLFSCRFFLCAPYFLQWLLHLLATTKIKLFGCLFCGCPFPAYLS